MKVLCVISIFRFNLKISYIFHRQTTTIKKQKVDRIEDRDEKTHSVFGKTVFVAYLQSQWSFLKTTKACTLTLLRLIWAKKEPFTALFTIFLFPLFKGLCRKSNSKRKQKKNCKATQHIMFVTFTTVPMVLSFYCWSRKSHFCPLLRLDSPTPKMVICQWIKLFLSSKSDEKQKKI